MQKIIASGLLGVLLVASSQAFAQFKNSVKGIQNLERAVARTTKPSMMKNPQLPQKMGSGSYDEIWRVMGKDKIFDDANNLHNSVLMLHLHKARLNKLRANQGNIDLKTAVVQGASIVFEQLNSSKELFDFLNQFPRVRRVADGFTAHVIPLPVQGLVQVNANGAKQVYNPNEHVLLFFEIGPAKIYPWIDVKNTALFTPLEDLSAASTSAELFAPHPQTDLWRTYEKAKTSWANDRRDELFESVWEYAYPRQFKSQAELGYVLDSFHAKMAVRALQKCKRSIGYIYEIPVKGLTCPLANVIPQEIDPDKYVFFYNDRDGGELIKREDVENALLYEFKEFK